MARMRVQETVRVAGAAPGNGGAYTGHKLALSSSPPLRAGSGTVSCPQACSPEVQDGKASAPRT